jgi:pyruvate,water dikinase
MNDFVKQFSELSGDSVKLAGGKGSSLAQMTHAGFPVPPGFVIITPAYQAFLKEHPRKEDIEAQLKRVRVDDMNSVERASVAIHDMIHDFPMPESIASECLDAFDALGAEFVAVRSSATAEDSSVASWAGELETYLNTTRDHLMENVKKCWASLFSPRAIFYRIENKMEDADVFVAVVVQKMVNSDSAGVCFTVHPVTQDRNQMIIEACVGLGEALVSGQITPDSFIIAKDTLVITDRYISTQTKRIVRGESGATVTYPMPPSDGARQKVSDAIILEVATCAKRIEEHYGFPVDIEWAVEGDEVYMTQARPITTLS